MALRPMLGQLLKPPGQALDAFASVLSEHWRAARECTAQLLWSTPVNWLEAALRAPVTTSRSAADSSGTPPDPHP